MAVLILVEAIRGAHRAVAHLFTVPDCIVNPHKQLVWACMQQQHSQCNGYLAEHMPAAMHTKQTPLQGSPAQLLPLRCLGFLNSKLGQTQPSCPGCRMQLGVSGAVLELSPSCRSTPPRFRMSRRSRLGSAKTTRRPRGGLSRTACITSSPVASMKSIAAPSSTRNFLPSSLASCVSICSLVWMLKLFFVLYSLDDLAHPGCPPASARYCDIQVV